MRRLGALAPLVLLASLVVYTPAGTRPVALHAQTAAASTGSWTVYHHDDGHTGYDSTQQQVVSASTGWVSAALDGQVYGEPLVYNGIVYAATLNNSVYALRQSDGVQVWHWRDATYGPPVSTGWGCGNVSPQGILGTGVIDTAGGRIYEATLSNVDKLYRVWGLNLATGAVELTTTIPTNLGSGFDWTIQQERGALALANGYVYVPFGGRAGDCGNYHGWVFAVPTNGTAVTHYYQTPGNGNGYWAAGGVVVDDSTGSVFETSGNGDVGNGCGHNVDGTPQFENDAVVRLSSTLAHQDFFMPQDWESDWCANDQDLGSASPLLISPSLMFQAGKWGMGFLLNPASLGGVDGQLYPTPKPATYSEAPVCFGNNSDATFGSFAYAAPFIYVECEGSGLVALSTNTSTPSFSPCDATCGGPNWSAGGGLTFGPPIVAGGAVWVIDTNGSGLYAFDAATGAPIYHSASFGANRFTTPAEAGGQVFVPSGTRIRDFTMNFACTGTPISTSYFQWFDNVTPGMVGDNIHILNTGASPSSGCVTVAGHPGVAFTAGAGQEVHVTMPRGTIGGPVLVTVNSGPPVLASQRVQYYQSFNEVWAMSASQAATLSYFQWFDTATPGMVGDNIHVLNPGASTASVSVGMPGASTISFSLAAGAEKHVSFGAGHIGGPVTVSASAPVLASQRVQYYQSFDEVLAGAASAAQTTSYFNWFDTETRGMVGDNIHVLNPGGSTATVTVTMPTTAPIHFTLAPGAEKHVSFGFRFIGGPVTVSSDAPVLASQRVQYYRSFSEVPAQAAAQAQTTSHIMWFDRVTPGMVGDNIHVLNPGASTATVSVGMPGASTISFTLGPGAEAHVTFGAGHIGGPVTISSDVAVLAAQRVQYYQSFNEVASG